MSTASVQASGLTNENEDEQYLNELGFNKESEFYKLLLAIEQLPQELQDSENAEEIANWLSSQSGLTITAEGEYLNFGNVQDPYATDLAFSIPELAACVGALGGLVPITKLFKIHKLLDTLGGATSVLGQVLTNYKYYRGKGDSQTKALTKALDDFSVANKLSETAKQLFKDLFNVSAIIGSCGALFSYENDKQNLMNEDGDYFFNENALKTFA